MCLIGDNEIEEPDIERLEHFLHRWIRGKENSFVSITLHARGNDPDRLRQEIIECVLGLLPQFTTITKKQNTLNPTGPDKQIPESDRDTRFSSASRLNDKRLSILV